MALKQLEKLKLGGKESKETGDKHELPNMSLDRLPGGSRVFATPVRKRK